MMVVFAGYGLVIVEVVAAFKFKTATCLVDSAEENYDPQQCIPRSVGSILTSK